MTVSVLSGRRCRRWWVEPGIDLAAGTARALAVRLAREPLCRSQGDLCGSNGWWCSVACMEARNPVGPAQCARAVALGPVLFLPRTWFPVLRNGGSTGFWFTTD